VVEEPIFEYTQPRSEEDAELIHAEPQELEAVQSIHLDHSKVTFDNDDDVSVVLQVNDEPDSPFAASVYEKDASEPVYFSQNRYEAPEESISVHTKASQPEPY
jgi:hypothetical protein